MTSELKLGIKAFTVMPSNLEDAKVEILKLKEMLFRENEKTATVAEKGERTKRSLMGEIKALKKELELLKGPAKKKKS